MKIAIVGFGVSGAALLMSLKTSGKLDANLPHVKLSKLFWVSHFTFNF